MPPIRVAQVVGKMMGGGVEAVVMNYYRHIDRGKVQFDFIVDEDSVLVPRSEIEALGGQVIEVSPYQHQLKYQKRLDWLFHQGCWQIVHSHINTLSVFPLFAAKRAGIRVRIAHSHSTMGHGEHAKNAMKLALRPFSNMFPTYRLACSNYAGEWLFGKRAPFDVLYNAIELDRFSFSREARLKGRTDLGLTDDTLVVGHVGRFMTQKNHIFLLESFEALLHLRKDAVLLLAGDGELRPFAERWVYDRGLSEKVLFLGQRDDIGTLYQVFDAFALPSLYEGLGLVGIEAQRAGLPCYLSDTIPHEVDVTGTVNFLPIDNPAEWAAHLALVKPGERKVALPDSFDNYDIDVQAPRLAELYQRLQLEAGL